MYKVTHTNTNRAGKLTRPRGGHEQQKDWKTKQIKRALRISSDADCKDREAPSVEHLGRVCNKSVEHLLQHKCSASVSYCMMRQ